VKILCKLSTETKRYSSHTIVQNFNLPAKQWSLLSTAIHWRQHSNAWLSSAPLVQRPNDSTGTLTRSRRPNAAGPAVIGSLTMVTAPTPLVQHDPQSWKLVVWRPHVRSHLLA